MKYDSLEKDIIQLQESMNIIHEMVQEQQSEIDTIEDYIKQSKEDTTNGTEDIKEVKK